jgi:hypothetical protein
VSGALVRSRDVRCRSRHKAFTGDLGAAPTSGLVAVSSPKCPVRDKPGVENYFLLRLLRRGPSA